MLYLSRSDRGLEEFCRIRWLESHSSVVLLLRERRPSSGNLPQRGFFAAPNNLMAERITQRSCVTYLEGSANDVATSVMIRCPTT